MLNKTNLFIIILITGFAAIFSSFTLWLLDSWIKYPLFIFEIFTIIVLYLIVSGYDVRLNIARAKIENFNVDLVFDVFFIVLSLSLLLLSISGVQGGVLQLIMALLVTSIFPGYALVNIFNLNHYFSRLELFVLSYVLSFVFTGLVTFVFLFFSENLRLYCIISTFIILGSVSFIKRRKTASFKICHQSFTRNIDFLAIIVAIAFFALFFYFIYPGFALLPGTDISQHYSSSILLWKVPNLYIGSTYLLSHLHESLFIALSNQSFVSVQVALLTLNFMLPLVFYVMAKAFLEKIDARLPSIATIFWVLFTNGFGGFSWIYFTYLKLSSPGQNQLQLLNMAADKTYNGTIYGVLGLWYIPATISFVLLMTAIFLLNKKEIPSSKYVILFSIIIAALYLTHVAEAVVFVLFLSFYGVISKNVNLKIDAALKASLIGFGLAAFIYYVFSQLTSRFVLNFALLASIVLPIFLLTISLIVRHFPIKIPSIRLRNRFSLASASKLLILIVLFAFFTALLSYVSFVGVFHTSQVDPMGVVPWFMYPLILGITGLLSMVTLYYIAENAGSYKSLRFFVAFLIFVFIAGTFVSILNLYFFNVDYYEKRFIWFMKLPLALLAPIPVLLLVDRLKKRVSVNIKTIFSIVLIGIICLYGVSTTFLNAEYWNITATNPVNYPSSLELSAIDAFKKILDNDPKAWSATVTSTSASTATFAAPDDTLILRQLLYAVHTPEMVLTQLYRNPIYSHPYIYLDNRDSIYLLNNYPDQFLSQYLLPTLPTVFSNSEVKIYNVSQPTFPQSSSGNVLLIPFDQSVADERSSLMAYYALSYGHYNYTVAYDTDHNALNSSSAVLSFDPPEENSITKDFHDEFNQTLDSWTMLNGNWHIDNKQLLGGKIGEFDEGLLLSQVSAENFTAAVKVTPLSGDKTTSNYASLVYSWTDSKNYRLADVFFNSNGYIYLLFRNFVNGIETDSPQWPGIKTDLKWAFNNDYSIKLTVNGTLNELSVNNSTLSLSNSETVQGKIGLHYYRFSSVSFDDFFVNYSQSLNSRPADDYLNYLNSGGKLIVMNTNGNGSFANDLFSNSNATVSVQNIDDNGTKVNLPHILSVPDLVIKDNNVIAVSNYSGSGYIVPFITQKNYENGGELFYVNVYPIVNAMQNSNNQSEFYGLLGKLLNGINLKILPSATSFPILNGYVKQISLKNNVQIETNSILFPSELNLKQVEVKSDNSSNIFYNVTSITLNDYSNVIIQL